MIAVRALTGLCREAVYGLALLAAVGGLWAVAADPPADRDPSPDAVATQSVTFVSATIAGLRADELAAVGRDPDAPVGSHRGE